MAKVKPSDKGAKGLWKAPNVAGLRNKIDRIDRQLVLFMNQRAKLAHRIGQIKDSVGHEAYDPAREEEVLSRAVTFNKGPLSTCSLRAVFRELIRGSPAFAPQLRGA